MSLATGMVQENKLLKLLNIDNSDGITFCLQYKLAELGTYNQYCIVFDNKFKQELKDKYGDKVLFFSSLLQEVD